MRTLFKNLAILSILLALVMTPIMVVKAAGVQEVVFSIHAQAGTPDQVPTPEDLAASVRNLAGVAVLASLLLNLGKKYLPQLFPDGSAPGWNLGLNIIFMAVLAFLQLSGRAETIPVLDQNAGAFANALTIILGLVGQLFASRVAHQEVLAGLPVVGTSNSGYVAGQGATIVGVVEDDLDDLTNQAD